MPHNRQPLDRPPLEPHAPPVLSAPQVAALRQALRAAGYQVDGLHRLLGSRAHAALGRGEPEAAAQRCTAGGPLATLVRLFLLAEPVADDELGAALHPLSTAEAEQAGLLAATARGWRALVDIRPFAVAEHSWWVASDPDPELDPDVHDETMHAEHVLGVGHASVSLARATIWGRASSVLDLGAGSGVQALAATAHADTVTATDVSPRATALARLSFQLNDVDVEQLTGPWLEPLAGRVFDQIVCNPPYVVGPPQVAHVYRDSGLAGDGASEQLIRQIPQHLTHGGHAQLLASWVHRRGQDWEQRVRSWIPDGVDAWVVQRDVADPALYVGTWLRDSGIDPASPQGRTASRHWLDWFAAEEVEAVGFGFVTLRPAAEPATVVCEDLREAFDDPLGAEAAHWLDRVDWLRGRDDQRLLAEPLRLAESVVLERIEHQGELGQGWQPMVTRLHRSDGPGWQHEADEFTAALLAGCQGALGTGDLLELLLAAWEISGSAAEPIRAAAPGLLRELVRHGMLVPARWEEQE